MMATLTAATPFAAFAQTTPTTSAPATSAPATSAAQAPSTGRAAPLVVLDVESEDAEDQADALTSALRSRLRSAGDIALVDTTQHLNALMIALKCPPKPDAACLQRIGDQLKTDRFVWGTLTRNASTHMVTSDVRVWSRGKAEASARETYNENIKDPGDESLLRIASRILEKTLGIPATGTLVVRASSDRGTVTIDNGAVYTLEKGQARVELKSGPHTVRVQAPGFVPSTQSVSVVSESDAVATFALVPGTVETESRAEEPSRPFPVRKVVGYSAIGLGAVGLSVALVHAIRFRKLEGDYDKLLEQVPQTIPDVCGRAAESNPNAVTACAKQRETRKVGNIGWAFAGAGAAVAIAGAIVLITEPRAKEPRPSGALRVVPSFDARGGGGGVDLLGSF